MIARYLAAALAAVMFAGTDSRAQQAPAVAKSPVNDSLIRLADLGRIMGSPNAKVWVIMSSDFQCPFCREWHDVIGPVLKREYVQTGKVRLAYINFPLTQHQHAWPAAEVAMCAGSMGRFWPVHDAIFSTQMTWKDLEPTAAAALFEQLATSKGVDRAKLRACVGSKAVRPLIQADYDRSITAGVRSTPTIIIGAERLPGVQPIENYRRAIDAALAPPAAPRP